MFLAELVKVGGLMGIPANCEPRALMEPMGRLSPGFFLAKFV